ncbi:bifunctional oligoribonuclease/PAP phosphatase NrnA [Horticoccus luteus]|uniref:Bifunctional oligoribonuclease/PAP phosphatase NrnA n=1 Tax=Horticoccus luteus TaxID=2862869 RepID=A0A8F9TZI1_9BACT|nr:bifunctional oligoribonuclease/PAP phosphatase NrnA [Horticoccus luteus]QYM80372.1 bifunctional oligoribonuclease/PAP phosphatase NrnA [Horticoccus luteus]
MSFYAELSPRFAAALAELSGRSIAVVGHARPDGDCIGSQVALARLLMSRGAEVVCVNADVVPRRLQFLVRGMTFLRTDDVLAAGRDYTSLFVDCADQRRVGERLSARFAQPFAVIDHHLSNVGYAQHNFIDTGSAATCEILAGLFIDNDWTIDAQTAQALYTGILTDTGQFRFNSTSQRTFLLAAELMARGAKPTEAGYELYERESMGKLHLLQRFLASLQLACDGRICIGRLPSGVFAETGTTAEDTEGLVDYARSIDGVDVGVLIEERPDGGVKASLRAKDPAYRLDLIAGQFNGGGHACAAGLNLATDAKDFQARLVAALSRQINQVDGARA